ncbi:MAG: hypothetical protein ACYC1Q_00595 [Bacteroidia bacterium]
MNLRKLLSLALATCLSQAYAQITVFQETMGTVSATTSLAQHSLQNGFDNDAYVFDDGNAANPVDVRSSSASSGAYVQCDSGVASGGANLWFGSSGERGFSITGIRAAAFDSLELYFGYRKESASSNACFRIDWSADGGQNWDSVSMNAYLPSDASSTGWYYIGPVLLPQNASENGLALRWIKSSGSMRIDDILLRGQVSSSFIQCTTASLSFLSYSDYSASSWQSITLETYAFQSGDSIFIQSSSPFSLAADTQNQSTELVVLPDSDYFTQEVWIRMEGAEDRGTYEESLHAFSSGTDTLEIDLQGSSYYAGENRTNWECEADTLAAEPEDFEIGTFIQGNNYGTTQFISSSVASDSYSGASGGNNASLAVATGAFDSLNSAFIGWYMVPDSGRELHVLGLSFGSRSTSSGPQAWCLRSSTDGFSGNLFQGSLSANSEWSQYADGTNTSSLSFTDSTYFKLFIYDGTGTASINIANFRLDDLELELAGWNTRSTANFRSSSCGNFHDSSIWSYTYYDTLYRNASQIPALNPVVNIREQDSVWLGANDTLMALEVEGKLALAGYDLVIEGALSCSGELVGNPASSLTFLGNGDSSTLRFASTLPEQSNGLAQLTLSCNIGYVNLIDTVYIHDWVSLEEGTLISAATLHLLQGENSAAQILPGGAGTITGAMCMQTMIPGQAAGWRSMFSPLDTVTLGQLGNQIELHLQNTASSGDNRNAFEWVESTASWNALNNASINLHEQAVHLYIFNPDSSVIELCGLYDTSEVSFGQLGFTSGNAQNEGWHLVGNPFPSSLRWSEVSLPTGANGNYAVWSEADGNYRPWNGATGSAGDLIPPCQGVWVKVNQALSQDFVLRNSYRDTGQVNHFGKRADLSWHLNNQLSGSSGYCDGIDIFLPGDSILEITHAPKLFGSAGAPQLWVEMKAKNWSIWRYQGEEKIPLSIEIPSSGTYVFSFPITAFPTAEWSLIDGKTGNDYPIIQGQELHLELEKGRHTKRFYLQKKVLELKEFQHQTAPEVFVIDRYIQIKTVGVESIEVVQPDGKTLHTYSAVKNSDCSRFGPLPYVSGLYILRFAYEGTFYSQLIYLP